MSLSVSVTGGAKVAKRKTVQSNLIPFRFKTLKLSTALQSARGVQIHTQIQIQIQIHSYTVLLSGAE